MNQERGVSLGLPRGAIVGAVFGLGIGLLLGLLYAYVIAPVQFTDAEPQHLRVDYASIYWQLVTESYSRHEDLDLAKRELGEWEDVERLQSVLARARIESAPEVSIAIDSLASKLGTEVSTPQETPAPGEESTGGSLLGNIKWGTFLGVLLLLLLLLAVIGLIISRSRIGKASSAGAGGRAASEEPEWVATVGAEGDTLAPAPVLGHFVASYSLGDDHYDESYSIETATGEFLGQCGVEVAEILGEGTPQRVTAFEVWLFEPNAIRTVTKVLMSEYAFDDVELRDRLAAKGEAVLVQANVPLVLETATLRVTATATEALYSQDDGQFMPNSTFDRLTVELVAQRREDKEEVPPDDEIDFGLDA